MSCRFLRCSVTNQISLVRFFRTDLRGFTIDTNPTRRRRFMTASDPRCFFGIVALAARLSAVLLSRLEWRPNDRPFNTAPTEFAMCGGFIFGIKTLQFARLCIGRAHLDGITVETYPAGFAIFLMALRLSSCRITLPAFFCTIIRCGLENSSIQATPAWQQNTTGLLRLLPRIETLPTSTFAIVLSRLDQVFPGAIYETAPTWLAFFLMPDRFFFCWIILAAPLFAFLRRAREDLSVKTAPAFAVSLGFFW